MEYMMAKHSHDDKATLWRLCVLLLTLGLISGCSTPYTGFPPRFKYDGRDYSYSGHSFNSVPAHYSLLGNVKDVLQVTWNYGDLFGREDSEIYKNTSTQESLLISARKGIYQLFLSKEMNSGHFIFVRGSLFRDTYQYVDAVPDGYVSYGELEVRVYDKYPDEELTWLGGWQRGGRVYISNRDEEHIYWEDIDYPGIYYLCEAYSP